MPASSNSTPHDFVLATDDVAAAGMCKVPSLGRVTCSRHHLRNNEPQGEAHGLDAADADTAGDLLLVLGLFLLVLKQANDDATMTGSLAAITAVT